TKCHNALPKPVTRTASARLGDVSRQERQYYCPFLSSLRPVDFVNTELTIGIMYTRVALLRHPVVDLKEVAMKVGDILRKKTARVATVRMNETVAIAAQLMRASNISALVVKDVVRT